MSRNIESIYPMSPLQEGMLYHGLLARDEALYVQQFVCELAGELDPSAMQAAWEESVARHSALRTLFAWDRKGPPLQIVRERVELPWSCLDWSGDNGEPFEQRLESFLKDDGGRDFDLTRAPLMRIHLIRRREDLHTLVWSFSHLILDGWSTAVLLREVLLIYSARRRGREPGLQPAYPFRDFIAQFQGRDAAGESSFWREYLGTEAELSMLSPCGFPAPKRTSAERHGETILEVSGADTARIEAGARRAKVTLNTLFQGAWALLLHRYTCESTITCGITVSGRSGTLPGIEQRVGFFMNTLALRTRVDPSVGLQQWLAMLQRRQHGALQHEQVPLAKVKSWCGVEPGEALFDTIIVFENYPLLETGEEGGSLQISTPRYYGSTEFPLSLIVIPEESLRIKAIFDHASFSRPVVEAVLENLRTVLLAMVEQPNASLGDLASLAPPEIARLRQFESGPKLDIPRDRRVHELIEAFAATAPDSLALTDGETALSYGELEERAGRLAARLGALGAARGVYVPILLVRSVDYVVAILAVLKTGAAYVPLDPTGPDQRIRQILEELQRAQGGGARIAVAARDTSEHLRLSDLILVSPRDALEDQDVPGEPFTPDPPRGDDVAYVIYTSGSTGRPKGVLVSHDNLLASTWARFEHYPKDPKRFLLLSPFAFDSSVAGIFWTLSRGGTLHVSAPGAEQDVAALAELIGAHGITHTLCLPSLYRYLLDYGRTDTLRTLEVVIVAGEACTEPLAALHRAKLPATALYNEYGPTETTVWCTAHRVDEAEAGAAVPIGRPIANARALVVDDRGVPQPGGAAGELVIAGSGLTRGYLNQPEMTAASFARIDPWGDGSFEVYKTGDKARFRPNGEIEFLGRKDDQIKLRGHRIEPAEIAAVVQRHPGIAEAAVVARPRSTGKPVDGPNRVPLPREAAMELVAFAVPSASGTASSSDLTEFLDEHLPDYMRPSAIVRLDRLPRTSTGKIDRRTLADSALPASATKDDSYLAPTTETERKLAVVWQEVLKIDRVGANDSFFRLGGDSLASIQVLALASRQGLELSANALFLRPVLRDLATALDSANADAGHLDAAASLGANVERIPTVKQERPFFSIYGEGWAEYFPPDKPYIWLPHPGQEYASVESLAATYIRDMRSVQPIGPYRLGGFSFGGLIALEVAQQLLRAGEEVEFLGLFEATPPKQFGDTLSPLTPVAALSIVGTPGIDRWVRVLRPARLRRNVKRVLVLFYAGWRQLQWHLARRRADEISPTLDVFHLAGLWVRAWREYECPRYPGRIVVFGAENSFQRAATRNRLHSWEKVAQSGVEFVQVEGIPKHLDLIRKPYSSLFATALIKRLDALGQAHSVSASVGASQAEEPGDDGSLYVRGP